MDPFYPVANATTLTETPKPLPKKESSATDDSVTFFAVLALAVFFAFWHSSPSSSAKASEGTARRIPSKAETEYKRLAEKERSATHALKTIALRKREIENDIRKAELEGFSSDSPSSFDSELKTDKLRMKLEELAVSEEKKAEELEEVRAEIARITEMPDAR